MAERENVILIGMPGVGKSTIGVLLAKHLGFSFLDTDIFIQSHEGMRLSEIIERVGLADFCDLEEKYILMMACKSHVISPGGSVVYRAVAMDHLKRIGTVVHLDLDPSALSDRLGDLSLRGVVHAPGQTVADLYQERLPLYITYADITVDCADLSPEQTARKIAALYRDRNTGSHKEI
jgi:shikimate kinase